MDGTTLVVAINTLNVKQTRSCTISVLRKSVRSWECKHATDGTKISNKLMQLSGKNVIKLYYDLLALVPLVQYTFVRDLLKHKKAHE